MSSPPKDEAGLNTPPKNNSPGNIAPNIEALPEADQKVEAQKLLKQEQKGPNGVTLPNQGRLKRHRSTQESEASPQSKRVITISRTETSQYQLGKSMQEMNASDLIASFDRDYGSEIMQGARQVFGLCDEKYDTCFLSGI
ncbi:hypothetical protein H9Q69_005002 [Fusarium xylarioides]|uniref:Uncharacterized protein n=1 Tax=Fusarium xylarioides TaxID=221167 RepID=A0A9P7LFQ4_9HYPO|nr:hypothetical protein H9Q70_012269 [Fusarium xylarioides]KAG5760415.1 hypothetical protein H9Q72_011463 [Fusarium xylarioides]KAG5773592.1 hypothetical protein H9Q73_012032 [Fusarium xylarioides]KAG5795926.1 hypothetical protein H9Q69_005002 [Fusarium xylarioides]KAG5804690.1 hypothetical protein H9Q71_010725 [Fusarium xylarioides]